MARDHFAYDLIDRMIQHDPKDRIPLPDVIKQLRPLVQLEGKLSELAYDEGNLLKIGSSSQFYRVTFRGESIAVKKLDTFYSSASCVEEFDKHKQLDHPNVVKISFSDVKNDYR